MGAETDDAERKAMARAAFRRVKQEREAILSGQGRTKVRHLGVEDEIEGLSREHQVAASREGSRRRLVSHSRSEPVTETGNREWLVDGHRLAGVSLAHVAALDSGRLSIVKVLRHTGWEPGQILRAVAVGDGLWQLTPSRSRRSASAIVGDRGRLALLEGFVRGADVAQWPGVLVMVDGDAVFLCDVRRACFPSLGAGG